MLCKDFVERFSKKRRNTSRAFGKTILTTLFVNGRTEASD